MPNAGQADYDRLSIAGTANLGGLLEVLRPAGFNPNQGAQFLVLESSDIEDDFSGVLLPDINPNVWDPIDVSPTGYLLKVQ